MPSIWRTVFGKDDAAERERDRRLAYRAIFASPLGQIVLADLMRRTGVVRTTFVPNDPTGTAFHEGQRRIGLYLVEMINSDPDAAARMLQQGQTEALFEQEAE